MGACFALAADPRRACAVRAASRCYQREAGPTTSAVCFSPSRWRMAVLFRAGPNCSLAPTPPVGECPLDRHTESWALLTGKSASAPRLTLKKEVELNNASVPLFFLVVCHKFHLTKTKYVWDILSSLKSQRPSSITLEVFLNKLLIV